MTGREVGGEDTRRARVMVEMDGARGGVQR